MTTERNFSEPNDDKWKPYHKAFYGIDIPESMRQKVAKPFVMMVEFMITDLIKHYSISPLTEQLLHRAVLAGLSKMCDLDVDYTGAYNNEMATKKEAFKTMISTVDRLKQQERLDAALKQEIAEREASPVVQENPKTKVLHDEFDMHYQYAYNEKGLPRHESNIDAYIALLKAHPTIEGVEHYVFFHLRYEKGIVDDPTVIQSLNAHPNMRDDHKPSRMRIRNKAWRGLGTQA